MDAWLVEEALNRIGPEHRAVLIETYYRGRSYAEVAAGLGIPEGTARSRAFYARLDLSASLPLPAASVVGVTEIGGDDVLRGDLRPRVDRSLGSIVRVLPGLDHLAAAARDVS